MKQLIAIIIALIAISSCVPKNQNSQGNTCDDPCPEAEKQNPWNQQCYNSGKNIFNTPETELIPPRDFGNGFYYFPGNKTRFVEAMSLFLRNHSGLEVTAITGEDVGYRYDVGYFVFFKTKSQNN